MLLYNLYEKLSDKQKKKINKAIEKKRRSLIENEILDKINNVKNIEELDKLEESLLNSEIDSEEENSEEECYNCNGSGKCNYCNGYGKYGDEDKTCFDCHPDHTGEHTGTCRICKGEKKIKIIEREKLTSNIKNKLNQREEVRICKECDGTGKSYRNGKLISKRCKECNGTGEIDFDSSDSEEEVLSKGKKKNNSSTSEEEMSSEEIKDKNKEDKSSSSEEEFIYSKRKLEEEKDSELKPEIKE